MALLLETALGDIVIDLDYEGSPALTRNILQLARADAYTRNLIYKVLPQRFCMTGCPVGDGSGGTSIQGLLKGTATALSTGTSRLLSPLELQEKGRVAVQGQSMGSQFLITIDQGKDHALDGMEGDFYSIGVVAEDDNNVLDKINAAYLDPNNRPYADIRILRALVVYDPFEKEHSPELIEYIKRCPSASPERPPQETVEKRISIADIDMDDEDENSSVDERKQKELQEEELQREAQSRAVVLEMLGDLPSADMKAPENVLFICKLNPVTTDEDLELIFSRFDQAVKVEIIRDHDTGDSLQYAFAEFTTSKQAQEAYFKMNHALVDDRRILVDFSQSVAKLWDKYHQKMKFSHSADAYQSHGRQPRRSDNRHNTKNYGQRDGHRHDRSRDEQRGRQDSQHDSQWRHNDHIRSPVHPKATHARHDRYLSGASEERQRRSRSDDHRRTHKRDRRSPDEDSYGRHRTYQDGGPTHIRSNTRSDKTHEEELSLRRYERDEGIGHDRERGDGEGRDYKRSREDEERHHRRERGGNDDIGRKRDRDDEGKRHKRERGDSEGRYHKRSRDDEGRRHKRERGDTKDYGHRKIRDDEGRRDKRERGESEHSYRRSRDDGERRHRSESKKRKHKNSRHDDERRQGKERRKSDDKDRRRHRDDEERRHEKGRQTREAS